MAADRGRGRGADLTAAGDAEAAAPNGIAAALAVAQAGADQTLNRKAAAYLDQQTRLTRLQMEHLHEQRALQVETLEHQARHLKLQHFDERLTVGLKLLAIAAGSLAALGLAAMVWSAVNDRSLVIQAFAAPPDYVQRGLGGQVLAAQVLDRITAMDARAESMRAAHTYANAWGDDVKVEIPDTGVSIGELDRWLRHSLGHQTRISGELFRAGQGPVLTVRAGEQAGHSFAQQGDDFDGLVRQAAEALYGETQPYRYSKYLEGQGRLAESLAVSRALARSGPVEERPWAWAQISNLDLLAGDARGAVAAADTALKLQPKLMIALENRAGGEQPLGWDEAALHDIERVEEVYSRNPDQLSAEGARAWANAARSLRLDYLGDRQAAVAAFAVTAAGPDFQHVARLSGPLGAYELALNHDVQAAERLRTPAPESVAGFLADIGLYPFMAYAEHAALDDWTAVLADLRAAEADAAGQGPAGRLYIERYLLPWRAQALARLGRGPEAVAAAAQAPLDCYLCLRMRGVAAAAAHDAQASDRWFAEAVRSAPSLPGANLEWAQALLARGDATGAIAKAVAAHGQGPRWSDPLELWGEALIAQGDAKGAAARFAEADRYAPRWGRNHLRWGEALLRQGRTREAQGQFETAKGLDLSVGDRAALRVFLAPVGPLASR